MGRSDSLSCSDVSTGGPRRVLVPCDFPFLGERERRTDRGGETKKDREKEGERDREGIDRDKERQTGGWGAGETETERDRETVRGREQEGAGRREPVAVKPLGRGNLAKRCM